MSSGDTGLSTQSGSGIRQTGKEKKTIFGMVEINEVQDAALSWTRGRTAGSDPPPPPPPTTPSLPHLVPKIIT